MASRSQIVRFAFESPWQPIITDSDKGFKENGQENKMTTKATSKKRDKKTQYEIYQTKTSHFLCNMFIGWKVGGGGVEGGRKRKNPIFSYENSKEGKEKKKKKKSKNKTGYYLSQMVIRLASSNSKTNHISFSRCQLPKKVITPKHRIA